MDGAQQGWGWVGAGSWSRPAGGYRQQRTGGWSLRRERVEGRAVGLTVARVCSPPRSEMPSGPRLPLFRGRGQGRVRSGANSPAPEAAD